MTTIPVADGLFTWPSDHPRLIGGSCRICGTTTFPRQGSCPKCTSREISERLLDREGTLWTFTVQGFRPKSPYAGPEDFETYGVLKLTLAPQGYTWEFLPEEGKNFHDSGTGICHNRAAQEARN